MRKTPVLAVIASAILAAVACQESLTGPSRNPRTSSTNESNASTVLTIAATDLMGIWQATKVDASSSLKPGVTRELVAEGGTVTLVLETTNEIVGLATPSGKYTITVTMPGMQPGVDSGFWFYSEYSIATGHSEYPQIDFYPASLGPDPEYGHIPGFLVTLSTDKNILRLWDSGLTFLPFDFGWGTTPGMNGTSLKLEFTRK